MNLFHRLKQRLTTNEFVGSVVVLMSGNTLSQIIVVLITPILTRIYGPESFGMFSIYLSMVFMIGPIIFLRYEQAIPLPKREADAINLFALATMILVIFIGTVITILLFLHQTIGILFPTTNIEEYLFFIPISLLGLGIFDIFILWSLRKEKYTRISRGRVQMNVFHAGGQLGFGFLSHSPTGLITGEVIGRLSGGIALAVLSRKEIRSNFSLISWKRMKQMAKRYRRFPLFTSWSSLLTALTSHLPTFFIASTLGVKAAGWYLIANRILALPSVLLGYSVEQVYYAKSAKLIHSSLHSFVYLFWQTVKKLSTISFIVFTMAVILAPVSFSLVFGESWREAGIFVQCMSIAFFVQLIVDPISRNFDLLELQHLEICGVLIHFFLLIGSMFFSSYFLVKDWQVVLTLSLADAIGFVVIGIYSWYALHLYKRKGDTRE